MFCVSVFALIQFTEGRAVWCADQQWSVSGRLKVDEAEEPENWWHTSGCSPTKTIRQCICRSHGNALNCANRYSEKEEIVGCFGRVARREFNGCL